MKKAAFNQKLLLTITIVLFLVFTVFLYGPLSIYLPNSEELWFHLDVVLKIVLPISLAVFVVLIIIGVILPIRINGVYIKILFGIALALYMQGNFINISYGHSVMDGKEIIWSNYTSYAVFDTCVWILCLALPWISALLFRKIKKLAQLETMNANKVMIYAALFFTAIQVPALISQILTYIPSSQGSLYISTEGMFEVAEKDNTFVFILDTLDGQYFQEFMDANPDYAKNLGGFTFYDNTTSAGGRTILAMPAMLTGQEYTRDVIYSKYLSNIWDGNNVLDSYHKAEADTRVYSESLYFDPEVASVVDNFSTDASAITTDIPVLREKLYRMTMYKFMPHLAKRYFTMTTSEFEDSKITEDTSDLELYKVNDIEFYDRFEKSGFKKNASYSKAFRLYHLHGAHGPFNMGEDGNKKADSTKEEQIKGNFYCINEMLEDLKKQGLYDDATIIITADHGDIHVAEWPTLLIKEAGKTSEDVYTVDHAPVSLFDLPIFLTDQTGYKLTKQTYGMKLSDLSEDMERERHYFENSSNSSKIVVNEYKIVGDVSETSNVVLLQQYEDPEKDASYQLGTILSFESDATANRYCVEGFGNSTGFRTKLYGPHASMAIPFESVPQADTFHCHLTATASLNKGVHIVIRSKDTKVYDAIIDKAMLEEGLDFDIPTLELDTSNMNMLELYFDFPELSEEEMKIEKIKERTCVASFNTIAFTEKVAEE